MDDLVKEEWMRIRLSNVIISITYSRSQERPGMDEATAHVLNEIEGKEMALFGFVSEKILKRKIMKLIKKEYLKRRKEKKG